MEYRKQYLFTLLLLLLIPISVITFFYGLDSGYLFKNGDEKVYMHIARMTASSNHWLPLQSIIDNMRNTKPPLLFWQGIMSTHWMEHWSFFYLRLPSVIYTFLTAILLFFTVSKFSKQVTLGILAALIWLTFMGTYRYGRPFMTEAPINFWLSLLFFSLLMWGKKAFESKIFFPSFAAICIGFVLLYKSFFYIIPVGITLSLWYCAWRDWNIKLALKQDSLKVIIIGSLSLAVFSLWFILDPMPMSIWQEFVLQENFGKMRPQHDSTYLLTFLWGERSLWFFILTSLVFSGFFFFVLLSTIKQCWQQRRLMLFEEKLLWLYIVIFFCIFCLPSHRSGRYMLPLMPAFAALIALYWDALPLWGFRVGLALQLIVSLFFAWISLRLENSIWLTHTWHFHHWHWVILLVTLSVIIVGIFYRRTTKALTLLGSFLCYCALTSTLSPLDGQLGHYSKKVMQFIQNKDIWIPCNFRARNEEYRLLLPGANIHGYREKYIRDTSLLPSFFPFYVALIPEGEKVILCDGCKIIGSRVHMQTRRASDLKELLNHNIENYLLVNEYLISSPIKNPQLDSKDSALIEVCQ